MKNYLDLSYCKPVNHLWTDLLKEFGLDKAKQMMSQAINLQKMQGNTKTIPVLFVKTGGVALTTYKLLRLQTGITLNENDSEVILYTQKSSSYQVLHETGTRQLKNLQ